MQQKFLVRRNARRLAMAVSAGAVMGAAHAASAASYSYTTTNTSNTAGTADSWNTGTGWGGSNPISDSATTLTFNGPTTAGVTRFTNNDLGSFTLNAMTLAGSGPASGTYTTNLTGGALTFAANGGTGPTVNRKLFWEYKANNQGAHRDGEWKYLRLAGHEYLFNLDFDVHERANFSKKEPARFEAMKKAHADWAATMLPYTPDTASYNIVGQVPDRYTPLSPASATPTQ